MLHAVNVLVWCCCGGGDGGVVDALVCDAKPTDVSWWRRWVIQSTRVCNAATAIMRFHDSPGATDTPNKDAHYPSAYIWLMNDIKFKYLISFFYFYTLVITEHHASHRSVWLSDQAVCPRFFASITKLLQWTARQQCACQGDGVRKSSNEIFIHYVELSLTTALFVIFDKHR